MKKIALLMIVTLFTVSASAQKKKAAKPAVKASPVLAKADNVSAEIVKNRFVVSVTNGKVKDSVFTRQFDPGLTIPKDVKITPFKAKGVQLYLIVWSQTHVLETKMKTEEATKTFSEVWDVTAKKLIFANHQINTKVSEIVFLDKNKTVSETQQKMRREGFDLTITPEGDLIQKNKTQESRLTYDVAKQEFVNVNIPKKKK